MVLAPGPLLSFKSGQFIMRRLVLKGDSADWFFGADEAGREGWFPAAVVQRSRPSRGDSSLSSSSSLSLSLSSSLASHNSLMTSPPKPSSSSGVSFAALAAESRAAEQAPEQVLECLKVCRATCDYAPTDPSHLQLKDGDIVAVYHETETLNKCYMLDGRMGTVPSKVLSVVHSVKPDIPLGRK